MDYIIQKQDCKASSFPGFLHTRTGPYLKEKASWGRGWIVKVLFIKYYFTELETKIKLSSTFKFFVSLPVRRNIYFLNYNLV